MANSLHADPLRAVIALDRQVNQARAVLQRTSELHPDFERRVAALVELVSQRDHVLACRRAYPPALSGRLPPAA